MVEISRRRHGHLESDSRLLGNLIILPPTTAFAPLTNESAPPTEAARRAQAPNHGLDAVGCDGNVVFLSTMCARLRDNVVDLGAPLEHPAQQSALALVVYGDDR